METLPPNGSPGAPTRLYDARQFSPLGFVLTPFPNRMPDAANDSVCPASDPPPVRPPPTVRPLDDLSVRRAEREFLRS